VKQNTEPSERRNKKAPAAHHFSLVFVVFVCWFGIQLGILRIRLQISLGFDTLTQADTQTHTSQHNHAHLGKKEDGEQCE